MSGIMGDEDNPEDERIDSVCEILSGATDEVRRTIMRADVCPPPPLSRFQPESPRSTVPQGLFGCCFSPIDYQLVTGRNASTVNRLANLLV